MVNLGTFHRIVSERETNGRGYLGRGMGISTAGTSVDAVLSANRMFRDIHELE